MRNKIFISHATPDDNEFASWLSFQLIGLGYQVWCDLLQLKGGEDFWSDIETEIRNNTVKYLYVLSSNSNNREGTLKELTVAQKTKKSLTPEDSDFIIPLHIDKNLSYDDTNIDLVRLNSINFKTSWHTGLIQLLDKFKEDSVPKSSENNFELVKELWQNIYLTGRKAIEKEEIYSSNWFRITSLPETIYYHRFAEQVPFKFPMWKCKFPARNYKGFFATFAGPHDFIEELPKTANYDPQSTIAINVNDILNGEYDTTFLSNDDARKTIIYLLNIAFKKFFKASGLKVYKLASKRIAFWFPKEALDKDKADGILMVGKMKYGKDNRINWHFGISGEAKSDSDLHYVIKSHIIFTWDGQSIIDKDSIQHRGRRKQGKNWWNKHWREKLLAFISIFGDEKNNIKIMVSEQKFIVVSSLPILFESPVSYNDPSDENLPEDDHESSMDDVDDEHLEIETDVDNE